MVDTPFCNVSIATPPADPTAGRLAAIPVATDLNSAIHAINALTAVIRQIIRPTKIDNGAKSRPTNVVRDDGSSKKKKDQNGRWNEVTRTTKKVKVFMKDSSGQDDPDTFVEFERMDSLTMKDSVTSEQWIWKRDR